MRGHHERRTELGFELARRDRVAQRVQDVRACAHAYRNDLFGPHVVVDHQPPHRIHRRVTQHAARIWLDRHARPHDRVRIAELADDAVGIEVVAVPEYLQEAPRTVQRALPPVKPFAASSAATMPFCAARPTWSGLVIVPKFTRMPAAMLAAIARACAVLSASSPINLAAAVGAKGPGRAGRVKSLLVVTRDESLRQACTRPRSRSGTPRERPPDTPWRSPTASAAISGGTVGCVSSPKMRSALVDSWVSSKSSAWPLVPFSRAADAAPVRNAVGPNAVASARTVRLTHVPRTILLRRPCVESGKHDAKRIDDAALPCADGVGGKSRIVQSRRTPVRVRDACLRGHVRRFSQPARRRAPAEPEVAEHTAW